MLRSYYNAVMKAELPLLTEGAHWFEIVQCGCGLDGYPLHVLRAGPASLKM